ncbi:carbonic anhydrase [Sphaerospermopsis aphanizomenoides BCCUSP55]|uniref:carbonic anhydrase family protein n=1 Tax=Sphaerospermopsis aphanizomenoides TaxID=459663 RepID=UPI001904A724|nr:carbonic anhydrase family protein [Sphaerospermopsis aphanizomenoides]MBK1990950.1 carbonic anhydrase [Sphaerospermopsis aphanizomenoides BCCUSP55]
MKKTLLFSALLLSAFLPFAGAQTTEQRQSSLTPEKVLKTLLAGNERFMDGQVHGHQDITARRVATAQGQYPKAVILSCLDSRIPVEQVFDLGIGDIFVGRVAGNVQDNDQLGSMEFATKLAGAKLVMVLGHTGCGAVRGACADAKLGHLTGLLQKIRPAVRAVKAETPGQKASTDPEFVDKVAAENVRLTVDSIRKQSPILAELERSGQIKIVGGMYDLETGKVSLVK